VRGRIVGRVIRLEYTREEALRSLRKRVVNAADRLGYPLTSEEREDIVQRHGRQNPTGIKELAAEGLSREEILERLLGAVGAV
jgi:hypothetical protein